MARIVLHEESEHHNGWVFEVEVHDGTPRAGTCRLALSWADYDHWGRGTIAPATVAERVVRFVLDRAGMDLLRSRDPFDASLARRRWPEIDDALAAPDF